MTTLPTKADLLNVLVGEPAPLLTFIAYAEPKPQGSKKGFIRGGKVVMVEDNDGTHAWRDIVTVYARQAAAKARLQTIDAPVRISITFTMPKPNRPTFRDWPAVPPDVDKLQRALFDALTAAKVWKDDSRAVDVHAVKAYPNGSPNALDRPGVHVRIWAVAA